MFSKNLSKPYRHFLDSILKVLSDNPVYREDTYIYKQTCFENTFKFINGYKFSFTDLKRILPIGYEYQFLQTALRYLESNKLISSIKYGEKSNYIISYEGLLLSKSGGLSVQNRNLRIKTVLQNLVWIVTLLAFLGTICSFFLQNHTSNKNSQKMLKIEKENKVLTHKILKLEEKVKEVEKKGE